MTAYEFIRRIRETQRTQGEVRTLFRAINVGASCEEIEDALLDRPLLIEGVLKDFEYGCSCYAITGRIHDGWYTRPRIQISDLAQEPYHIEDERRSTKNSDEPRAKRLRGKGKKANPFAWTSNTVTLISDVIPAVEDVLRRKGKIRTKEILGYLTIHNSSKLSEKQITAIIHAANGKELRKCNGGLYNGKQNEVWESTTPVEAGKYYYQGRLCTTSYISEGAAISRIAIIKRLKNGWDAHHARNVNATKKSSQV